MRIEYVKNAFFCCFCAVYTAHFLLLILTCKISVFCQLSVHNSLDFRAVASAGCRTTLGSLAAVAGFTAAGTSRTPAKLHKISGEPSPPLRQTLLN